MPTPQDDTPAEIDTTEKSRIGKVELKVTFEYGPAVQSATPAAHHHTTVVVTDSSAVPQEPVVLAPNETSFSAWVKPGGGNIVVTDYDEDDKVLNTAVQEFTDAGTVGGYKPIANIIVAPTAAADKNFGAPQKRMPQGSSKGDGKDAVSNDRVAAVPESPTPQTHASTPSAALP